MSHQNLSDAIERERRDFGYDAPEAHDEEPWTDAQYARQRRVLESCGRIERRVQSRLYGR